MSFGDPYRKRAATLRASALKAPSDRAAADLRSLARCYLRLASEADYKERLDVSADFGQKLHLESGEEGA
jgi:hypothetical protein